jgi:hypothetical protein
VIIERAYFNLERGKNLLLITAAVIALFVITEFDQGKGQLQAQSELAQVPAAQSAKLPQWQTAAGGRLSFEVASLRLSAPNAPPSENSFQINAQDDFSSTGGFFRSSAHLIMYIIFAYKIVDTSQYGSLLAQLPKWGNYGSVCYRGACRRQSYQKSIPPYDAVSACGPLQIGDSHRDQAASGLRANLEQVWIAGATTPDASGRHTLS